MAGYVKNLMVQSIKPTLGIYFVVRFPDRWRLIAHRCEAATDLGHPHYWKELAPVLAEAWCKRDAGWRSLDLHEKRQRIARMAERLASQYDGFPRGRIAQPSGVRIPRIYHGENVEPWMKIGRQEIERAFGLEGRAKWVFDDHEQCIRTSRDAVMEVLGLTRQWKCVPEQTGEFQ